MSSEQLPASPATCRLAEEILQLGASALDSLGEEISSIASVAKGLKEEVDHAETEWTHMKRQLTSRLHATSVKTVSSCVDLKNEFLALEGGVRALKNLGVTLKNNGPDRDCQFHLDTFTQQWNTGAFALTGARDILQVLCGEWRALKEETTEAIRACMETKATMGNYADAASRQDQLQKDLENLQFREKLMRYGGYAITGACVGLALVVCFTPAGPAVAASLVKAAETLAAGTAAAAATGSEATGTLSAVSAASSAFVTAAAVGGAQATAASGATIIAGASVLGSAAARKFLMQAQDKYRKCAALASELEEVSAELASIKLKAEARIQNLEKLSHDVDEIKENLEFMPAWCKEVASWADRTADEAGAVEERRRGRTQLEFVRLQWSDDGDLDACMANTQATLVAIRNLVGACDRLKDLVAKVQGKYVEKDGLERGSPIDDGQGLSSKKGPKVDNAIAASLVTGGLARDA